MKKPIGDISDLLRETSGEWRGYICSVGREVQVQWRRIYMPSQVMYSYIAIAVK
jgi:hypothetical protein